MTRIALVGDSHFSEDSRFDECIRLHSWIANDAADRGCAALLHSGDLYHSKSTPREREAVAGWISELCDLGIPLVAVRGNHDAPGDVYYLRRLAAEPDVCEAPAINTWAIPGVTVACLPWPSRAGILAAAQSREDGEQTIQEALRNCLRWLGSSARAVGNPVLFLGHCMVRDSRTSTGQPLVGCDVEIGLEDLALVGADAYLLGHIHLHQRWEIDGAPCIYPGSPRRTAFGEMEAKGYVVLDVEPGKLVTWEFVEAPATPMVDVIGSWVDGSMIINDPPAVACAELRFRYAVAAEHREASRLAARELASEWELEGALSVKIEEVVSATTRARAPEVATAPTVGDKLRALWGYQGRTPERAERLLSMVAGLEEESIHAL